MIETLLITIFLVWMGACWLVLFMYIIYKWLSCRFDKQEMEIYEKEVRRKL